MVVTLTGHTGCQGLLLTSCAGCCEKIMAEISVDPGGGDDRET